MAEQITEQDLEASAGSWLTRYLGTALVVFNGLLLSFVACFVLNLVTRDMQTLEIDHNAKGVFASIQQNMQRFEASIGALAAVMEDYEFTLTEESLAYLKSTTSSVRGFKTLIAARRTEDGWYKIEVIAGEGIDTIAPGQPLPRGGMLQERIENMQEDSDNPDSTLFYVVSSLGGLIPSDAGGLRRPIAFLKKIDQGGTQKLLMIITETSSIFGVNWQVGNPNLVRAVVYDPLTSDAMYQAILPNANRLLPFTQLTRHTYKMAIGDQVWEARLELAPSRGTMMLGYLPYLMLAFGCMVTLVFGVYMYNKQRQELKMARITETLEGTSTELKKKILERDKLFHQLRRSERENRALVNSISDVIFETDKDGRLVFVNKSWERITDISPEEVLKKHLFDLIEPDDQDTERKKFREMVSGERQAYRSETRIKTASGGSKAIELAISMLRVADDGGIRVVGTITDIEQRMRAEMALREAEKKYRAIVENIASGIYQSTPDGRFLSANQALADILGYDDPHDLIESVTNIGKQVYVDPKDRVAFASKLESEGRVQGLETQVYRKDGTKIWISENARAVRSVGKVQYYEGLIEDITRRHEAEQALREAKLQSDITSRAKTEFLANMSHELRTPLNAVIGFSEILKDEIFGDIGKPEYKEYAQDIYESGQHLLRVINEILEVSRIEIGNRDLNENPFSLHKVIKDCLALMQPRADAGGVEIRNEIPKDLPDIFGEELAFKQILANLLSNAIKFTPSGGAVTIRAEIGAVGRMHIEVIDTGIGIPEDQIEKALSPFGQVNTNLNREQSGTGLGLTIVESLARLHNGDFQLVSREGQGTTARVVLPSDRVMNGKQRSKNKKGVA